MVIHIHYSDSSPFVTSPHPHPHGLESCILQQDFYIKAPTPAAASSTKTNALEPSKVLAPEVDVADEAELLRVAVEVMVAMFAVFVADLEEGHVSQIWVCYQTLDK